MPRKWKKGWKKPIKGGIGPIKGGIGLLKYLFPLVMIMGFLYNSMLTDAGWSSLAARRAHNPKVVGSNPAPATKE